MSVSESISVKMNNMRIIAAALVVSIHLGVVFEKWSPGWWVSELTRSGVSTIAVPFFFIVSGFFLMGKQYTTYREWWKTEVVKRVRTLLVPMVIWTVLGVLWSTPFIIVANKMAGRELTHAVLFFNGQWLPGLGHLWYVRFLFVMTMAFPLLAYLVRKWQVKWVVLTFIVCWCVYSCPWIDGEMKSYFDWRGFNLSGLAYLSLGAFCRMEYERNALRSSCWACDFCLNRYACLFFGGGLFVIAIWLRGLDVNIQISHLAIPITLLGVWQFVPTERFPKWLTSAAFPVYLLHTLVILPTNIVYKHLGFIDGCVSYCCRWVTVFVFSVVISLMMRRWMPRVSAVLFGGR